MNSRKTLTIIMAISLILGSYQSIAQTAEELFPKGIQLEEVKGELGKAIEVYQTIVTQFSANRPISSKALLHIGLCYEKLGNTEARKAYERLVRDYSDQTGIVAQAQARLAALKGPADTGGPVTRRILEDASGIKGVLTADGKYIRGIDWETGDVVQFEVASGQKTRITNKGAWSDSVPALQQQEFSPDGKQIVFDGLSSDPLTKDWLHQLRIRNLDGTGLRIFCSTNAQDIVSYLCDWSPDGGSILVFREREDPNELALISTADGSIRILIKNFTIPMAWLRVRFSPDGRFIAYSSMSEGSQPHGEVFLMTADGLNKVIVAGHPAEDRLLDWTPDGRSLVFLSDRSGTWDIWTVRITDGKQQGEPELLKKDFGYDPEILGFAPDGSCYYKTVTPLGGLYNGTIDLETGKVIVPPVQVATRYTGPPSQPTWSPDGRNLLYISRWGFGPGKDIVTIRSTATGEERLLSGLGMINQISWAPDSRNIIALGTVKGERAAVRIDTETNEITWLATFRLSPKICPDGKTLLSAYGPILKKLNLDTGVESEVVNAGTGGTAQWLYDLSPDGQEVVFQVDSIVKIVRLSGGEPRELFRGSVENYRLKWTGDGRYIIARGDEILRVPVQGGKPLKLDLSFSKISGFALHPDNRRFVCSVDEGSKIELWVAENLLSK